MIDEKPLPHEWRVDRTAQGFTYWQCSHCPARRTTVASLDDPEPCPARVPKPDAAAVERCGWCGKEPGAYGGKVFCKTFGCMNDVNCPRDEVNWNLYQRRIRAELERREREAFESGARLAGEADAQLFHNMAKAASKSAEDQKTKSYVKRECEFYATQCGVTLEEEWRDYIAGRKP